MSKYVPRLYVSSDLFEDQTLDLNPTQHHYLLSVMRLKPSNPVVLFNGRHGEWNGSVEVMDKKKGSLLVGNQRRRQPEKSLNITLAFSPLKGKAEDFLIEKSVELGVDRLCPVASHYTQGRDFREDKAKIHILEASEQCERLTVPVLEPLQKLSHFLEAWDPGIPLFVALERSHQRSLWEAIPTVKVSSLGILIGPEGGWSEDERNLFVSHPKTTCVHLGDSILRAETAGIMALSLVRVQV